MNLALVRHVGDVRDGSPVDRHLALDELLFALRALAREDAGQFAGCEAVVTMLPSGDGATVSSGDARSRPWSDCAHVGASVR